MKTQREVEFDKNYSVLTFASAITFTIYFLLFTLILNLTYLPITIKNNGFSGVLVLLAYYFLTSIVLAPILIIFNGFLGLTVTKLMKIAYIKNQLLGFVIYPAIMTVIPYLINLISELFVGNIKSFDYYFIYFATWISGIFQYIWMLKYIKDKPEYLTEKQAEFLKKTDQVDYF